VQVISALDAECRIHAGAHVGCAEGAE
jgi:hypothetical protein